MARIAVVYLARRAEGLEPASRFIASYQKHGAGLRHDLIVVFKGHDSDADFTAFRALFGATPIHVIRTDDTGFDIGAYLLAASQLGHDYLCFLNTFTEIVATDWLAKLRDGILGPGVGLVGAMGSYESIYDTADYISKVIWLCEVRGIPFDERIAWQFDFALRSNAPKWLDQSRRALVRKFVARARRLAHGDFLSKNVLRRGYARHWRHLTSPGGALASFVEFPRFPNPHIRTNGFMIKRTLLLDLGLPTPKSKNASHLFESGYDGLTRSIARRGLSSLIVDRDGFRYGIEEWPQSSTFRLGKQENLMITDNQSRGFLEMNEGSRLTLARASWGDYLGPAPEGFLDFGYKFARGDLTLADHSF